MRAESWFLLMFSWAYSRDRSSMSGGKINVNNNVEGIEVF
jgi:hypothetical protein